MNKLSTVKKVMTVSKVDTTIDGGFGHLSNHNFKILESLSKVDAIRDFRLKDLMNELGMDTKQPAIFYRELVKEIRDVTALFSELRSQLINSEKLKAQALVRVSSLEEELTALSARIASLETGNNQLHVSVTALQAMVESYRALKTILIGDMSLQVLDNLCDLIHAAYMAKAAAEIGKFQPAIEPKQVEVLRKKLREELRTILQVPETSLEKELARVKRENEALTSALLALSHTAI